NVIYAQGCELSEGIPSFETMPSHTLFHGNEKGLKAEYFDNHELKGTPLYSEVDTVLNANWYDKAPRKDMDDDNFGVRWTGEITPDETGMYQLGIITTCKVNLYLNDSIIANTSYHFRDEFGDPRLRKSVPIKLEVGRKYNIKVEAGETYADAQVQLVWAKPKADIKVQLRDQAIEAAKKSDVVVMCMGLTARLEGEEMDVAVDGFNGGDRTKIDLPKDQEDLVKEIQALGKPVVLVLLNGSALSINWENQNIPAIIEAWYPGQAAGTAIADVLFGDYNPAGRLPVTFYRSINDLPSFENYDMKGRTYRYFHGEPLYPFGYGLSYSTFEYSNFKTNPSYAAGDSVKISVDVKNTGSMAGDEVVQVYVTSKDAGNIPVPIRSLKAFKRIHLNEGETKTVNLSLSPDAFSYINDQNKKDILKGKYEISAGGGQPDIRIKSSSNVLKTEITIN
ncbi:MAG: glycoside hydrolase family 3 C-terminal domain-containing protein, partial [Bacteroidia bacterium]|nr:glycoside hydrolase family 3 C-terminal domain-containing protein [Bacteroidia bacterium]